MFASVVSLPASPSALFPPSRNRAVLTHGGGLQKPARILSTFLIHHCHCFYLRKTAPSLRRQTPNLPIHATSSSSARLKAPTQPAAATTPSAMAGASGAACDGGGGVRPFFEVSSWQNRFPRRFVRNFVHRNVRPFQMTREDHILEDETYIL